ncbi:SDR family NAD(P)-dependent oxidoreductase [Streptomyces sp. ZAF1911]|uniref:SDR family NAD(P)-dependent oxidoreductase n=1 Tax=Streptomyces sp. ZAF1911 TaxID=2944129 RepID=UPI00237A5FDE|nr:SDR family NAD(P)-dependent oxidoreductase [Streptomyces sp. ZAF1911]MDD9381802.1 SDR family NAD(P)-dependent oxidoreductase [Streptomyces sp. ZAF1911]
MTARTALVTGASSGIGRAFARELAAAGWTVTLVARGEDRLRALADELGPGHRHLAADLSTPEGQGLVAAELHRRPVNLLVNSAGIAHHGPFAGSDPQDALAATHLGCDAVITLAHAFLSGARRGDALVNVSSTLGSAPSPGLAVYSAGKAFVTAFSEALWHEQRPCGVHVMALCPGPTAADPETETESEPVPVPVPTTEAEAEPTSAAPPPPVSPPRRHQDAPAALVQSPEAVVRAALRALDRRSTRPTVVPGRANSLFVLAARLLPRRTLLNMLSR